jgi:hypothetical protein
MDAVGKGAQVFRRFAFEKGDANEGHGSLLFEILTGGASHGRLIHKIRMYRTYDPEKWD